MMNSNDVPPDDIVRVYHEPPRLIRHVYTDVRPSAWLGIAFVGVVAFWFIIVLTTLAVLG